MSRQRGIQALEPKERLATFGIFPVATLIVALSVVSPSRSAAAQHGDFGLGAIEGFVRVADGANRSSTRVENTTDPAVCGREQSLEDLEVAEDDHGVAHVTVVLLDVPRDRVGEIRPKRVVLANRQCRFDPHVAVVTVGDTVVTTNMDSTLHTTHYYGVLRGNVSLPARGMAVSRIARMPGMITVLCDIHGWMKAFIRVDEHAFHAVSDGAGRFRIPAVPPGAYTLEVWHETLGTQRVSVEVQADTTTRIDVAYPDVHREGL